MSLRDRLALLASAGVDVAVVQRFSRRFASVSAEDFLSRFVVGILGAQLVVVGDDLNFGRDRAGDVGLLAQAGRTHGFEVEVVPPVTVDGLSARSSEIRRRVAAGDVGTAARLLGRLHFVRGRVGHGAGRGAGLGFATANLVPETELVPGPGVYATVARLGRKRIDGVTSIGNTPTFGGSETVVEAHLFAEVGDVYGRPMTLEFVDRIRDQKRFESTDALVRQIGEDIETARRMHAARRG